MLRSAIVENLFILWYFLILSDYLYKWHVLYPVGYNPLWIYRARNKLNLIELFTYRTPRRTVSQLKICDLQEKLLKVLKCYNFLWVQQQHNCSAEASFANCVMTLYLLKVHLQTFLSIPVTQKCQISSCDSVLVGVRYISTPHSLQWTGVIKQWT